MNHSVFLALDDFICGVKSLFAALQGPLCLRCFWTPHGCCEIPFLRSSRVISILGKGGAGEGAGRVLRRPGRVAGLKAILFIGGLTMICLPRVFVPLMLSPQKDDLCLLLAALITASLSGRVQALAGRTVVRPAPR